jgi:hypothetical protein
MADFQDDLRETAAAKGEALRRKRSGGGTGFTAG